MKPTSEHRLSEPSKGRLRHLLGSRVRSDAVVALYEHLSVFASAPQQARDLLVAKGRASNALSEILGSIESSPDLESFLSANTPEWAQWKRSAQSMRDRLQSDVPRQRGGRPRTPKRDGIGAALAGAFLLAGFPLQRANKRSKYARAYTLVCKDAGIAPPRSGWNSQTIKDCIRAGEAVATTLTGAPGARVLWQQFRFQLVRAHSDEQQDLALSEISLSGVKPHQRFAPQK